jgi:hypothetical protein
MVVPDTTPDMVTEPTVYDHLRPTTATVPDGVYRVVGTDGKTVTLLHVADADGTRRSTGKLIRVEHADLEGFTAAANPDGNRPAGSRLRGALGMPRWAGQAYLEVIRDHPIRGGGTALLFVVGLFGGLLDVLPGLTGTVLVLVGGLGFLWVLRGPQ